MRFSLFQVLLLLLALIYCLSEEISTSEQPTRRSFFRKVGNVYKKTKQGLRNMFSWKRRGSRGTEDERHQEQNPIGEGISAVMEAIDEIVADGEAAAKNAAKSAKEAGDKSEKVVEQPALEPEEIIPPTAKVEAGAESKVEDMTHVEDGDDSNTNTKDEAVALEDEDESKDVKPASHDTASSVDDDGVASSNGDATTDDAVSDDKERVPDRTYKASDTKEEL